MTSQSVPTRARTSVSFAAVFLSLFSLHASAQRPEARILEPVDGTVRMTLAGSRLPVARSDHDAGRMPADTRLEGVTLVFNRSTTQQAALDALIAAQGDRNSPKYQQWLSPEQFAAQFGVADADLAKAQTWLEQQGLTVTEIARSRDRISFNGSIAQIEAAFGTEMHFFRGASEMHFAPSTDLSVPAALAASVLGVANLSDMRPKSHVKMMPAVVAPKGEFTSFTSSTSGNHYVTPKDVATIYDVNAAYNAGYTGQGQTIAVVGQSSVVTTDVTNFQTAAGVPVRAPSVVLVPGTGSPAVSQGDELESDLDLEYTSSMAKGANVVFVYTGNSPNSGGAFEAIQYAVTNKLAPIISVSYGLCETSLGTYFSFYNGMLQQAAVQGQSLIVAAGDSGSTDCSGDTSLTVTQQQALAVEFPADSQYVTGMGGTEFLTSAVATGNSTYFTAANGSDVIGSALSYIPEMAWNDDTAAYGLSSGGGGASINAPRPIWQTGVPGIPAGSFRLIPDISLASSPVNAGYIYCSSDPSVSTAGSCTSGFRDPTGHLNVAGGTSFAAPIFAGMLALINQKVAPLGQGLINPTLYAIASNPTTYASAFHDITIGGNSCSAGSTYCGTIGAGMFPAGVGYDQATGLGSIDLNNLLSVWAATGTTVSTTTITAATLSPLAGSSDLLTITVAPQATSTMTPTGVVTLSLDGGYAGLVPLTNGKASYYFTSTAVGTHTITAVYTGDATFASSFGQLAVNVGASTLKATTTTVSAATLVPVSGVNDAVTISISGTNPAAGGSVDVTLDNGAQTLVPVVNGVATYTFNSSVQGSHTISALYLSDANYATSSALLNLTVRSPGNFVLSAPASSVSAGNTYTETITLTPSGGFNGGVNLSLSTPTVIANSCYTLTSPTVSGTAAVQVVATIYTNSLSCPSGAQPLLARGGAAQHALSPPAPKPGSRMPAGLAMAGLLAIGFAGRRSRKLRGAIAVALLAAAGFGLSGCGSGNTSAASGTGIPTTAAKGTYTVTVSGADAISGLNTATTTFALTIQ